ncbi:MAG: F0F1 ATP synthase subunit A [Candidatus Omnitrophica bacterium]|nr:F0F1 ATP synthase subunit A [Candidatus Omnitrophota bacterium]
MTEAAVQKPFLIDEYIMHHVLNSHEWHIPFLPTIHLPQYFSLHAVMLVICSSILILLFCVLYDKKRRVPTGLTNALEAIVQFIRDDIAINSLGREDGIKFTPLLCNFFFFILFLNLMGMVPLFSTATANIMVTGALSAIILTMLTVGTILRGGIKGFLHALIPSGIPPVMVPFFLLIEFLMLFVKSAALMIRLFANMLAGHMVILSLLGLVVMLGVFGLPSVILAVAVSCLEVFVAFLQAYIFTLLSAVFIGQMYHPEH